MASRRRGSLTARQNEIYEFIRTRIEKELSPPTIPEIARQFGLNSTNGVYEHLQALVAKGYITRSPGKARGISLIEADISIGSGAGTKVGQIPIVGDGHSSNPFSIFMRPRGMFTPDPELMPTENAFVAIVADDGMDGEGIFKGDYAVVRQTTDPPAGALVFALVGSQGVVRRLEESGPRRYLVAVNRHYARKGVLPGSPETAVLGVVVSVVRRLGK